MHIRKVRNQCCLAAALVLKALPAQAAVDADPRFGTLESSYRFLVSDRAQGGIIYHATAGRLKGRALPLSFYDTADYWGRHVCQYPSRTCAVVDIYDPAAYTLEPQKGAAGDLQTERVNIHNGTNIYDAATWQIAVILGAVRNGFGSARYVDAYQLANNQNHLLQLGYSGDAPHFVAGANRAVTREGRFSYNGTSVSKLEQAYLFRMLGRSWLNADPFVGTRYASLFSTRNLPANNTTYKPGLISWTDWKPFSGENAWAFLIGPLQAAHIHYVEGQGVDGNKSTHIPYADIAVQNALQVLPTFAAMQSAIGAVYYAPSGTLRNQGRETVNPFEVAVENNTSMLAGLQILRSTLQAQLAHDDDLGRSDVAQIHTVLASINVMINGGKHADGRSTAGLLSFFRHQAWIDGEFVQGGIVDPTRKSAAWQPTRSPKAIDANTWTVSVLGSRRVDEWFGFGASYRLWQQMKRWGGYGKDKKILGVGFSDIDGNGSSDDGTYRQTVMSSEWSAGAINMLRNMIAYYAGVAETSPHGAAAKGYVDALRQDEAAMVEALQQLRYDRYVTSNVEGKPQDYRELVPQFAQPYLYSNRRYLVPFGWYANPLPSTCATAWVVMLANRYDPLAYAGKYN